MGGLVAGLRAGHAFPTFPLLAGAWIPEGLWAMSWESLFFSGLTVMFQHRVLGILMLALTYALAFRASTLEKRGNPDDITAILIKCEKCLAFVRGNVSGHLSHE